MLRIPIDVATRVSPGLAALIESRINEPDTEQPITLTDVRNYFTGLLPAAFNESERMHHFDVSDSIIDELDALIEEFGATALAMDFAQVSASEALSRVIEAVVNDENRENPPTLGAIREAIVAGLGPRLVGEGVLEDDEDDNLLAEVDALIERYGQDSLAESLLRYE